MKYGNLNKTDNKNGKQEDGYHEGTLQFCHGQEKEQGIAWLPLSVNLKSQE